MSKLQDLIDRLCPDGVPFKPLKLLAEIGTGSSDKKDAIENGRYPFFVRSKIIERHNIYEYDEEAVIIPGEGGIGDIFHYVNEPYALHQRVYRVHFIDKRINTKFAYYYLHANFKSFITKRAVSATVTSIRKPMIEQFSIPVPPLEVQEEIVRILDIFSAHAAELQAELQARKEQYEYYRNLLLTFNPSACGYGTDDEQKMNDVTIAPPSSYKIIWKTMGEICKISRGVRVVKNDLMAYGSIPVYQNSLTPLGYNNVSNYKGDTTFIIGAGAAGDIGYSPIPFWAADDCFPILCGESVISKYIYHYLLVNKIKIKSWVRKASIPRLSRQPIEKMPIPIPPIEQQERIVAILDRFETLVNDLTKGLPAEIEAVKERYEYYRNKLLTFKPITA